MNDAELFQKLMDKNNKPSARKIVTNADICDIVISRTSWLPSTAGIAERLWNLFHNYTSYNKSCLRCGKSITAFRSWTDGYLADYCSKSCQRKTGRKPKRKLSTEQRELNKIAAKEKRKQTFIDRYGVTSNFSKNTSELRLKRFISKFIAARDDISLLSDVNEYSGNRQQLNWICNTCCTKFEENIFSGPHCPTCFTPNASTGQHEVNNFIRSLGFATRLNDRKLSKNKFELDIWLSEKQVCFEYDGLYWHSERGRPDIKNNHY